MMMAVLLRARHWVLTFEAGSDGTRDLHCHIDNGNVRDRYHVLLRSRHCLLAFLR
jgi:hypothetical protein